MHSQTYDGAAIHQTKNERTTSHRLNEICVVWQVTLTELNDIFGQESLSSYRFVAGLLRIVQLPDVDRTLAVHTLTQARDNRRNLVENGRRGLSRVRSWTPADITAAHTELASVSRQYFLPTAEFQESTEGVQASTTSEVQEQGTGELADSDDVACEAPQRQDNGDRTVEHNSSLVRSGQVAKASMTPPSKTLRMPRRKAVKPKQKVVARQQRTSEIAERAEREEETQVDQSVVSEGGIKYGQLDQADLVALKHRQFRDIIKSFVDNESTDTIQKNIDSYWKDNPYCTPPPSKNEHHYRLDTLADAAISRRDSTPLSPTSHPSVKEEGRAALDKLSALPDSATGSILDVSTDTTFAVQLQPQPSQEPSTQQQQETLADAPDLSVAVSEQLQLRADTTPSCRKTTRTTTGSRSPTADLQQTGSEDEQFSTVGMHDSITPLVHDCQPALATTIDITHTKDDDVTSATDPVADPVTLKALETLKPARWLNDEVIRAVLEIFEIKGFLCLHPLAIDTVEKTEKSFQRVDLEDVTFVVAPILQFGQHWTLLVANLTKKSIIYHNSLQPSTDALEDAVSRLMAWLKKIIPETQEPSWEICSKRSAMQVNGNDCGVYAIVHALYEISGLHMPMTIDCLSWREVFIALIRCEKPAEILERTSADDVTPHPGIQETAVCSITHKVSSISTMVRSLKNSIREREVHLSQVKDIYAVLSTLSMQLVEQVNKDVMELQEKRSNLKQKGENAATIISLARGLANENIVSIAMESEIHQCNKEMRKIERRQHIDESHMKAIKVALELAKELMEQAALEVQEVREGARQVTDMIDDL